MRTLNQNCKQTLQKLPTDKRAFLQNVLKPFFDTRACSTDTLVPLLSISPKQFRHTGVGIVYRTFRHACVRLRHTYFGHPRLSGVLGGRMFIHPQPPTPENTLPWGWGRIREGGLNKIQPRGASKYTPSP